MGLNSTRGSQDKSQFKTQTILSQVFLIVFTATLTLYTATFWLQHSPHICSDGSDAKNAACASSWRLRAFRFITREQPGDGVLSGQPFQSLPALQQVQILPSSSIWCSGQGSENRICRVQNLCYLPRRRSYFVVKTHTSIRQGVSWERESGLVDLSSLHDHPSFVFEYTEINPQHPQFQNLTVRHFSKPTFIISRFHPTNIMHTLHDDAIGLYQVLKEFSHLRDTDGSEKVIGQPFPKDNLIHFADGHDAGPHADVYDSLTSNKIIYRNDLDADVETVTCFQNAIVGNSKLLNWYQYGFSESQGPIANKAINGHHLRDFTDYVASQAGFTSDVTKIPPSTEHFDSEKVKEILADAGVTATTKELIVIFSRLQNRLILNEDDVASALRMEYDLPVVYVSMEELSFLEQVAILRRARLAIGMHGSILIMAMFMPRGATLLELYPYAVSAENYTPYKTMAALPGIDLRYRSWENTHLENNIPHPDWDPMEGGIDHLPPHERSEILLSTTVPNHLCCTDPYWLFRIYQDTAVHVGELMNIVRESLEHPFTPPDPLDSIYIEPSNIDSDSVKCSFAKEPYLNVSWSPPWNGVIPEQYSVWEHFLQKEYLTNDNWLSFEVDMTKATYVWVRPSRGNWRGQYSERIECVPDGVVSDNEW